MVCTQCEEAARGCACTARGVCGTDLETAGLQDVQIRVCRGRVSRNLAAGEGSPDVGVVLAEALIGTLTSVEIDPDRIRRLIREALGLRDLLPPTGPDEPGASTWTPADGAAIAAKAGDIAADAASDDDVHSLPPWPGSRASGPTPATHASPGYTHATATAFLQQALAAGLREQSVDEFVGLALERGSIGSPPSPSSTRRRPRPSATPLSPPYGPRRETGRGAS